MPIRLRDVADRAGVSVKTVTNVVNGYVHVAPRDPRARAGGDRRDRLPAQPHRPQPARGRTGVIALAVPELDNPYFAELTRFVVEAAEEHGWTVLVDQTDGLLERERLVADRVPAPADRRADPQPDRAGYATTSPSAARTTPPLVLLGEKLDAGPHDHVGDRQRGGRAGRDRATCWTLGPRADRGDRSPAGQQRALRCGAPAAPGLGGGAPLGRACPPTTAAGRGAERSGREHGAAAMARLLDLDLRPDAVFCFNDTLALGVAAAARRPRDPGPGGRRRDRGRRHRGGPLRGAYARAPSRPTRRGIARTAVDMLAERLKPEGTPARAPRRTRRLRAGAARVDGGRDSAIWRRSVSDRSGCRREVRTVEEACREALAAHRHQADPGVLAQVVAPHAAANPAGAVAGSCRRCSGPGPAGARRRPAARSSSPADRPRRCRSAGTPARRRAPPWPTRSAGSPRSRRAPASGSGRRRRRARSPPARSCGSSPRAAGRAAPGSPPRSHRAGAGRRQHRGGVVVLAGQVAGLGVPAQVTGLDAVGRRRPARAPRTSASSRPSAKSSEYAGIGRPALQRGGSGRSAAPSAGPSVAGAGIGLSEAHRPARTSATRHARSVGSSSAGRLVKPGSVVEVGVAFGRRRGRSSTTGRRRR